MIWEIVIVLVCIFLLGFHIHPLEKAAIRMIKSGERECYDTGVPYKMARTYAIRQEEVEFGEFLGAVYFTTQIRGKKYRLLITLSLNSNAALDIEDYAEYKSRREEGVQAIAQKIKNEKSIF